MTNKDFLSQFSGDNKKPDSFKEEERIKVTKEKKPVNVKLIVIILAIVLAIAGLVLFLVLRPTIEVRDFVGTNAAEVKAWIKQNDIESQGVIFREEYSFDYDEGYIIYQSIEPDKKIRKNTKMDFTVSMGADPDELISVPDIETMYKDELQEWVKQNKLTKTKIMSQYSDTVEDGAVISYEFKGSDADTFTRSSILNINVSKGPAPAGTVTVEDFVKQDFSVVEAWGKKNKVEIIKTTKYDDKAPKDQVISQSIEAKKTVKEGESLTVVVSLGKGVIVPDFTTMSNSDIDEWITANKDYVKQEKVYSSSDEYILEQSIASGSYIGEDNKIKLIVNLGSNFYLGDLKAWQGESYDWYKEYAENLDNIGLEIDTHKNYVSSKEARGTIIGVDKIYSGNIVYSEVQKLPLKVDITFNVANGYFHFPAEEFEGKKVSDLKNWIKNNVSYGIELAGGKDDDYTISSQDPFEYSPTEDTTIVSGEIYIEYGTKITIK